MEEIFIVFFRLDNKKFESNSVNINWHFQALELQVRELEERKKAFEHERIEWEQANGVTLDELRRKSLEANSKE